MGLSTKSTKKIECAIELYELTEQRRAIEKREKELKEFFKEEIGEGGALNAGPIIILLENCQRTSLDKKQLVIELGAERVKKFERVTYFKKFTLKRVA